MTTRDDVNDLARVLIDAWEAVEAPVTVSYVANFADMARAAIGAGWTPPSATAPLHIKPPPACANHREVQHRDRMPPWCNECGWHHGTIQYQTPFKGGTPRADRPRPRTIT